MVLSRFDSPRGGVAAKLCVAVGALLAIVVVDTVAAENGFGWQRPGVCFPPPVPVFGEPIADVKGARPPPEWQSPAGLADFVSEMFYPALSSRLLAGGVGRKLQVRLDAYRNRRGELLNELADTLTSLQGADPVARAAELKALAERQSAAILALEREAEEIRRALVDGTFFEFNVDWNRARTWRVGRTRFPNEAFEREAEFQIVRAAAFYGQGLTIEQRGLLLELATDLQARARIAASYSLGPRRSDPGAMFFSPATARTRLPTNPTPRLVSLWARFNKAKLELKTELREAVVAHEQDRDDFRPDSYDALAEKQWPRLVELEKLADEIREETTTLPSAPLRAGPQIPPDLIARIDAYNRDRGKFLEDFEQTVRTAIDMHEGVVRARTLAPEERRRAARALADELAALRVSVTNRFIEASQERYELMRRRYEAIQEDLQLVAAGQFDTETGKPLTAETLLRGFHQAKERFDAFGREEVIYGGYRIAMLMPGLSAEQRRLLFGAALVGLARPLPDAEPMPNAPQPFPAR